MSCETKLGYDDITIVPEPISNISSRAQCFCRDKNFQLPIFTAPMDGVIDLDTKENFVAKGINTVLPRTIPFDCRITQLYSTIPNAFVAFSLQEAFYLLLDQTAFEKEIKALRVDMANQYRQWHICIDIANGHMEKLLNTIRKIKDTYGDRVVIMSGNIANPKTYELYEQAGCDYVRCNIGSGSRCTTSSNLGLHYPCFSLLKEVWEEKQRINGKCQIIADGGIKGYRDVQKALLYADYVMIGGLFNKAIDSAGTPVYGKSYWKLFGKQVLNPFKTLFTYGKVVKRKDYEKVLKLIKKGKLEVWKEFYGMSTKIAQAKMNPDAKLKTSEGMVKRQKVEYSIAQWVENEVDYLRSVMSYTNSHDLEEYKNSKWVRIAYRAFND